ncbi:MAG: TetR/AcrR family transcriptional regulator [Acidobacteriota bacterium]
MSSRISAQVEEKFDQDCETKQPGRPRCPLAHQNILKAARELVNEIGFGCLTIEGIAARAGVGKTTIYRRWPNKASIVLDAFFEDDSPQIAFSDTGNVRDDIRRQMRKLVKELNGPLGCKISMLLANGQFDEEMAEAFRARWIEPRRAEARQVIKRGIERGEIRQKVDADVLVDALYGPVYFRLLGEHAPLTQSFADALVELVMSGLDG